MKATSDRKPRLFIASSVEGKDTANAVNATLDHSFEVSLWSDGIFNLSSTAIQDLVERAQTFDFALFVFTPDDTAIIRGKEKVIARDNVLFELGLFIGTLGLERALVLQPRGVALHLPSDLLGLNTEDYAPDRSDGNLKAAVNKACTNILEHSRKIGLLTTTQRAQIQSNKEIIYDYVLRDFDFSVLGCCLETEVRDPRGKSLSSIRSDLGGPYGGHPKLNTSLIKLVRMRLLERTLEEDTQDDYTYYGYRVTATGIDQVLAHEQSQQMSNEENLGIENIPF